MSKKRLQTMLIIKGKSSYNAVRVFMDELREGFEQYGIRCTLFDASQYDNGDGFFTKELFPALTKELEKQPDLIFSATGLLINNVQRYLKRKKISIPFLAYYVDHPLWNHERLSIPLENYHTVFVDPTFTEYVLDYYPAISDSYTVFQAGILSEKSGLAFHARENAVVFFGSYRNSQEIYKEITAQNNSSVSYIKQMLEYGKLHTEETIESIVSNVFAKNNIIFPHDRIPEILSASKAVEEYLRSYFREKCIQTLVNNGLAIHIYGNGWENLPVNNKHLLQVHPPVDYREMADIMTRYRFSLNILPWAKSGFHDRLATSMLNGCFCITDTSTYLEDKIFDGKLLTYHLSQEQALADSLKKYLASEEKSECIARSGQKYAIENHMWKHRAEQFINIMHTFL